MCFLSVYSLKSIISIGIVVTLLIGISLLYVLVYAFVISSVTAQVQPTFRNFFIGGFLTSSILLILSSLLGIYGMIRKRNQFVVIYSLTVFVYFIAFVVLGVFVAYYPNTIQQDCMNGTPNKFTEAIQQANLTLCKSCECGFKNFEAYNQTQIQTLQKMGFTNYPDDPNGTLPINAENCQGWDNSTFSVTDQMLMIESFFNCSGWCDIEPSYNLYYFFTNVNDGVPADTCVNSMLAFFSTFGLVIEISSFCASAIILLILITIVCLCCHPERRQQYDAMQIFKTSFIINDEAYDQPESQSMRGK